MTTPLQMQLAASIQLKPDLTVLAAHFHTPIPATDAYTLLDQILKSLPKTTQNASFETDDYAVAYEFPILLIARAPANARLLIDKAQQLSREIENADTPFDSLFLLQESLFTWSISPQVRVSMHSEVEERHIAEQKRKAEEADRIRREREAELSRQGKIEGHGVDESVLREMRERAVKSAGQEAAEEQPRLRQRQPAASERSSDSDDSSDEPEPERTKEVKRRVRTVVVRKGVKIQ